MAAPSPAAPDAAPRTASWGDITETQARRWLRYNGYNGIANLHFDRNGHWQAQATQNGRRVKVVLGEQSTATEQK
jgi:hypothetical protein